MTEFFYQSFKEHVNTNVFSDIRDTPAPGYERQERIRSLGERLLSWPWRPWNKKEIWYEKPLYIYVSTLPSASLAGKVTRIP